VAWRSARRAAFINQRAAIPKETLAHWRRQIDRQIESGFPDLARGTPAVIAICWPYRNEYDARHLAARWRRAGAVIALPVVLAARSPLVFREWHPGAAMAAGPLGIPYPVQGPALLPSVVLMPMAGFDDAGYRLGYGGGYFDRTLAALTPHPLSIGVAHEFARLPTIFPQSHDVPVDFVVTEAGIYRRTTGALGSRLEPAGAATRGAE
jgi:5,10-methenyltetrahydrofolate synthetase